jgi:hypothetical protein
MGVEDHYEGGVNLQEEVVDLQPEVDLWGEVDPQVVEDLQEEVEVDFWLEVVYLSVFLGQVPLKPMVSTTNTHYPCGSFVKEIVVIPNLLC